MCIRDSSSRARSSRRAGRARSPRRAAGRSVEMATKTATKMEDCTARSAGPPSRKKAELRHVLTHPATCTPGSISLPAARFVTHEASETSHTPSRRHAEPGAPSAGAAAADRRAVLRGFPDELLPARNEPKPRRARARARAAAPPAPGRLGHISPRHGAGLCCLLYTSPSPRDATLSRMPSSA